MNTHTIDYIQAIGDLPPGGTLTLTEVPWEDYEQLLKALGNSYTVRISYDRGRMEIMSPSHMHERFKEFLSRLAYLIAEETGFELESLGSTTYKLERFARGVQPDACFYVRNAGRIIGKDLIDLRNDPPPDVVVEIDVSNDLKSKLEIYADMRVPEVWRYDGNQAVIYQLSGQSYVEIPASKNFPLLTSEAMTHFLEQGKTEGQTATLRSFRDWLRYQQAPQKRE